MLDQCDRNKDKEVVHLNKGNIPETGKITVVVDLAKGDQEYTDRVSLGSPEYTESQGRSLGQELMSSERQYSVIKASIKRTSEQVDSGDGSLTLDETRDDTGVEDHVIDRILSMSYI